MATLADQIAWEKVCIDRGSEKYYEQQDRLRESGNMEQTDVVSYLFKQRIVELAEALKARAYRTVGRGVQWNRELRNATVDDDYHKIAYIAIQLIELLSSFTKESSFNSSPYISLSKYFIVQVNQA